MRFLDHPILAGTQEITLEEAAALCFLWEAPSRAAIARLTTFALEHPALLPHSATKATGKPLPSA